MANIEYRVSNIEHQISSIEMETVELKHTTQIRVRYADTDKMGIVYNGNYLAFFETGRTELMRAHGLAYRNLEKEGYWLPLIESRVFYKTSAFYDDLLDVEAKFVYEHKPFIKFDYRITCNGSLIAEGYTIHSFMKSDTRKTVKPPKIFVDAVMAVGKNVAV